MNAPKSRDHGKGFEIQPKVIDIHAGIKADFTKAENKCFRYRSGESMLVSARIETN